MLYLAEFYLPEGLRLADVARRARQLGTEPAEFGSDYQDHGPLFCWQDGSRTRTRLRGGSNGSPSGLAGLEPATFGL